MDDALRTRLEAMKQEILDATHEVNAALEAEDEKREIQTSRKVDALAARWNEFKGALDEKEREAVERRMADLRRAAAALSRRDSGSAVAKAADAGNPFLLRREPPRSIMPSRAAPTRDRPKYSVGGEVEAWCGKCGGLTTHHIVALVGGEPKQVICQACNSKHNYRTEAARKTPGAVTAQTGTTRGHGASSGGTVDREAQKRREQADALRRELDAAEAPRPFDPKGRYKAGEIIVHPEHGRGRVENVLRTSLLVKFRDGLKPLDLK